MHALRRDTKVLQSIDGSSLESHDLPSPPPEHDPKPFESGAERLRATREYQEATIFDTTSEKAIFDEYYSLSNSEQRPIIDPFTMVLKASLFQTRDGSLVRHLAI